MIKFLTAALCLNSKNAVIKQLGEFNLVCHCFQVALDEGKMNVNVQEWSLGKIVS